MSLLEPVVLVGLVILHRADITVPEREAGRRASWAEKRRSLGRTMPYGT